VSWSCGSIISSRVLAFSSYRTTGVIGALLLIAGTGLLVSLDRDSAFWWLLPAALLVGLGMGFCNQTFLLTVQGGVGWNERGAATSSFLFLRTIVQALGAAFGGAILNFGVARHVPAAGDVMGGLFDPARRASLGADMVARLRDAIAGALHHVYIIAGILAVLTLIVTMLLPAKLGPAQSSRQ